MTTDVNVSDELFVIAKTNGLASGRTPSKQIEYWAYIGKLMEENPDIPFKTLQEDIELAEIVRQRKSELSIIIDINDL